MKAYLSPLLFLVLITLLPQGRLHAQNPSSSGTYTVPTSIPFQAYLVDDYGTPVTTSSGSPLSMRFGIYINNTRVWYASYSAVNVVGGSFTVDLGGDYNVAIGLDPSTGTQLSGTLPTPITPGLISTFSTSSTASIQIQISNGEEGYTTLSPNVPINSSMFAIRADNVGGFEASQLTKTDSNGNILDYNGDPIVSSSGVWLGTGGGPPGPAGVQGDPGPQGATGATGPGFNFVGQWNGYSNITYNPNDVVTWNNSMYVEIGNPEQNEYDSPDTDPTDWTVVAQGFYFTGAFTTYGPSGGDEPYSPYDVVTYDGQEWICVNSPDSYPYSNPEVDTSDWQLFVAGYGENYDFQFDYTYYPNDVVYYDGQEWICINTNSEDPEDDTEDWQLYVQGFGFQGAWSAYNNYYLNDVVTYNGSVYIANDTTYGNSYVASTSPQQDSGPDGDWTLYVQGFNPVGPFVSGSTYYLGDVAYYNNSSYVYINPTPGLSGSTPDLDTTNWTLFAAGGPGATGATGAQGNSGPQGPTGAAGATGATGPAGAAGGAGTAGAKGATGATGATGPAGANGATGAAGVAGTSGATGPAGPTGATGVAGSQGATGSQGLAGAAGATGAQGPAGAAGANGADGATGVAGVAGATGAAGPKGPVGPAGAQGPSGPPSFAGARWVGLGMAAKTLTAIGGEALSGSGTATASPQADAFYVRWQSAATAKKVAGVVGPYTQTQSRYNPVYTALIRTGSSITQQRIWVALTSADLSQSDGVGSVATRYIGVRFSTSAGDIDWQLASGDGTTGSVQDTGIAVQPNTSYLIVLNWATSGQLDCQINNVSCADKTTNLDTGNPTNLGVECVTTTLAGAAAFDYISYISLLYNGNDF